MAAFLYDFVLLFRYHKTMIEQLFGSKTRVKLLKLFFSNPNRSFYVREITRKIDEQINSVRRELSNLLSIGIIKSDTSNNKLYYEVNQKYEYYPQLSGIFGHSKIELTKKDPAKGEEDTSFKDLGGLNLLLLTGSFTRDSKAGIDVLFVGDINPTKTAKYVAEMEKQEGRELAYAILSSDEFDYRRQIKDKFVTSIINARYTIVHDPNNTMTKTEEQNGD